MALSNWELLAFDTNGNSCDGILEVKSIASVEIYKNRLHVKDERMWHPESRWVKPVIAEIYSGYMYLSNFEIQSYRSLQNSIFCYIESNFENEFMRMAGIGCYAFKTAQDYAIEMGIDSNFDWYLISEADEKGNWKRYLERFYDETEESIKSKKIEIPEKLYEDSWVGVKKETFDEFVKWLSEIEVSKDWLDKIIKSDTSFQFNQGDAYFVKHLNSIVKTPLIKALTKETLKGHSNDNQ